ncbi:MAG TPA: type II toxin-antitoxin system VapC family toxin [Candidatus Acidoferrum sp.]|nr:type II toxin-antitoxin system VapC family toxin [Candidatus Acidoferrum sp.]
MKGIVIDASVALAWCFPDEANDYADSVLLALESQSVIVPAIWGLEITNALVVGERRKRIRQPEVRRFVELLNGLSVVEDGQPFADTASNVLPMAREYDLSAYDAAYLDVAVRHEIPLATFDATLHTACTLAGIKIFKGRS